MNTYDPKLTEELLDERYKLGGLPMRMRQQLIACADALAKSEANLAAEHSRAEFFRTATLSMEKERDELGAERDALRAQVAELRSILPVPDQQGLSFGTTWISWDKLVGWESNDGPERSAWYRGSIIAKGLMAWRERLLAALSSTAPQSKGDAK